ncbi:MAG TPA: tetratricopeptide repeat protein, partial [Chitinophagaceae bacterium]|nr:tetratricopeptide repeat protein [Chitinophagaceae bacterium]
MKKDKTIQLQEKIDQLNQQAWDIRVNDSPRSFILSRKSLELARSIHYKKGIAEGARSMGFCYVRLSKNDEALPLLDESLSLFKELNDFKGQALVYEYLGVIKRNRGDLGGALDLLFKSVALSQQTGSSENESIQHYQLGVVYKYLGNFGKALDSLFKSIAIHKENKNRLYQSYPINVIGSIYFETGDYIRALNSYKESLKLRQEFGDKLGESGSLDNIGYTLFKLKKYTQALKYCKQGLDISKKTGDKRSQASCLQHLAEIHAHAGDIKQAITSSNASRKIRKVTGDKRGEAEILLFLASLPQQDPKKVVEWIKEALQIAKETKSPDIQSKAHHCLYNYHKEQGQFKEANRELEKHFKLEKELQKNSVNQKIANLEITRKAEETRKEANVMIQKNEELTWLNKELEIEASLERVRTVAMSMHKREDLLRICEVFFKELGALGFTEIRNALIHIYNDEKGYYYDYDYSDFTGGKITHLSYKGNADMEDFLAEIRKSDDAFVEKIFAGKQLDEWRAFRKRSGQIIDERLNAARQINYYFYSIGLGNIGISNFGKIDNDQLEILKRFRNVFDFSYRRYIDIEQAEAQAYEAKIEASLERMRAAAMSMHKTTDLLYVTEAMYKELTVLGFTNIRNAQISIRNAANHSYFVSEYSEYVQIAVAEAKYESSPLVSELYDEMEKSKDVFYQREFTGKKFEDWRKWRLSINTAQDPRILTASSMWFYLYSIGTGYVGVSTFGDISSEQVAILKRFKNVFELSYQRYTDVAKAEAQAREAQIQLALERVRARTMAMQHSEELSKTVAALFEQFNALGEAPERMAIEIVNEKEKVFEIWATQHGGAQLDLLLKVSIDEPHVMQKMYKAWKKQARSITIDLQGVALDEYFQFLKKEGLPVDRKIFGKRRVQNVATFSKGILTIITPEPRPAETIQLLERFANVFDGTYTRFLDLQKAEAQARESQIELALERVRARTMAMQKSDELKDVIQVVYEQFVHLKINTEHTGFVMDYKQRDDRLIWVAGKRGVPAQLTIPYFDCEYYDRFNEAKDKGWDFFATNLGFEEKNSFYQELFTHIPGLPEEEKQFYFNCPGLAISTVLLENVGLYIENFEGIPYPDEDNAILMRFGKVFQQTYTRFLDLQKAEAQAREAEIELALERVRARTMAMQKSDELIETAVILFDQLKQLGEHLERTIIGVINEEERVVDFWATRPGGSHMDKMQQFPLDEPIVMPRVYAAWKQQQKSIVIDLRGEELERYFQFIKGRNPKMQREKFGERRVEKFAFFSKGFIGAINEDPNAPANVGLYERFAAVFDQTYTRFLDLQKAEAQSRESQIELGLERVRARAMAMQTSDELKGLIGTVFTELTKLDLVLTRSVIMIYNDETNSSKWWMANSEDPENPAGFYVKAHDHPPNVAYFKNWRDRKLKWTYVLENQVKADWDAFLFGETELKHLPELVIDGMKAPRKVYLNASFNSFGNLTLASLEPLSEEHFDILLRFAKVFDLTYTRFNDLQKAEAQAKEAKIEVALERVRARTMAMHKSDELAEVVGLLYKQFEELDFEFYQVLVSIYDINNKVIEWWSRGLGDIDVPQRNIIPIIDHPFSNDLFAKWKSGIDYYPHVFEGASKKSWEEYLFTQTSLKNFPQEVKDQMTGLDRVYLSDFFIKYGSLQAAGPIPLPEDKAGILKRFAKVLDLAYTRMADLQKAEAQAKEARIEAALEKVRSRSLAMHKSDELQEVVTTVFDRLKDLGIQMDAINLDVFKENKKDAYLWTAVPGQLYSKEFHIPYTDSVIFKDIYDGMTSGKGIHSKVYSKEEKNEFLEHIFAHSDFKPIPQDRKDMLYAMEGSTVAVAYATNTAIIGQRYTIKPFTDEETDILKRFANVFEQCYTRFKDLEKAEAQAREAQVEASLERVRAKAMAMHHSVELDEVLETLFDQFDILGINPMSTHITLIDVPTNTFTFRETGKGGRKNFGVQTVAIDSMDIWKDAAERWKSSEPLSLNILHFPKESLPMVWQVFHESFASMPEGAKITPDDYPDGIYHTAGNCKFGYIGMNQTRKATPEEEQIVLKFAVEFGRLYQRFLDLQKAEVQIREARIEAALEKVRSSSLAMHKSDELKNVVKVVFENFQSLGLKNIDSVNINIFHGGSKDFDLWLAAPGQDYTRNFRLPYLDHPIANDFFKARENGETLHQKVYAHAIKNAYFGYMFEHSDNKNLPEDRKQLILNGPAYAVATGIGRHASIFIHNYSGLPFSYEVQGILMRFTRVFDQTYRRFLDLQKSEEQAREVQIELSLERVRAKTMAMHNSQDVGETVAMMFDELLKLGVETLRCGVGILQEGYQMELWTAKPDEAGKTSLVVGSMDMKMHPLLEGGYDTWKNKKDIFSYVLKGDDLISYFTAINNYPDYPIQYDIAALPSTIFHNEFHFGEGTLFAFSLEQLSDEKRKIFKRFAGVFGQTYRRYLDLQKAEAQTREAQIEASLERVRSKAMAMHNSQDLHDTIVAFYHELETYSITPRRCGVGLIDKVSHMVELSTINTTEQGKTVEVIGKLKLTGHPVLEGIYDNWITQTEYYPVLRGNDIRDYYKLIRPQIAFPEYPTDAVQYGYFFYFKEGGVYAWTDKELADDELKVYRRFTSVLSLTYKRYKDLKEAEAQARESQIEAALERVRSKAMAMQKSDDLADAVKIVFEELDKMNLGMLRCGIGILSKEKRCAEVWSTTKSDNNTVVQVSGDESMDIHPLLSGAFDAWVKQENHSYVLEGEDLHNYYKALTGVNFKLPESQSLVSGTNDIKQYYYNAVFTSGGLFAFRETPFPEEAKNVLRRFSDVFNFTYTRFNDLKQAEAQARESRIQLALERVRARTMAMQKSEELADAAVVLFQQFAALGETPDRISIGIIDEQNGSSDVWATDQAGTQVKIRFKARNDERTTIQQMLQAWKAGKKSLSVDLQGKGL